MSDDGKVRSLILFPKRDGNFMVCRYFDKPY